MAIVFSKDIATDKLLTAYNNHIVRFSSDSSLTPATAQIVGLGMDVLLYPHPNGTFYFNFIEYVTAEINTKNFADDIVYNLSDSDTNSFTYDVANGFYLEGTVTFRINFTDTSIEAASRDLKFYIGVDQIEDYKKNQILFVPNRIAILSPVQDRSNNSTYLKYWQGYPFEFTFYNPQGTTDPFILKNLSNGLQHEFQLKGKFTSLYLSDGRTDITIENFLPMMLGENNIQFYIGAINQNVNLIVDKQESDCGTYIKFLNKNGRFSYWLLSKFHFRTRTSKYGSELENDFESLEDTSSPTLQGGKTGDETIKCAAEKLTDREKIIFEGIIDSPKIYMFTGERFAKSNLSDWMEVRLKTSSFVITEPRKKLYSYIIELDLPARYMQIL
ncbi:hypothetical protein EV143_11818 [Flavobacterium chryseum]|uniref:hypothetical protein n=1 Tax=Flavobacterium sp. P3160 TaxID=2512113 RepID=UPI00105B49A5|nr:hypothetical protein [Flavobacterium sp. P3160]TDO68834.1 hypothetical protein EV143_11818 [Flavobacterium sp. P3160]